VHNLEAIKSAYFWREDYPALLELLKEGKIEEIKNWPGGRGKTGEYLEIFLFTDQDNQNYVVSMYDGIEMWQDPQLIDIFPFEPNPAAL
jgi:hypothetical protein